MSLRTLVLTGLACAFFATSARAEDQVGDQKTVTWTLRCTTTAKSGADKIGTSGTFVIETTETFKAHDIAIEDHAITLDSGRIVIPAKSRIQRMWDDSSVRWKVVQVDEVHTLSFAKKFEETCSTGCSVHGWEGVDIGAMYFVAARAAETPYRVGTSSEAVSQWYFEHHKSHPEFAKYQWAAFNGYLTKFDYQDASDPTHRESGTCERQG